jgi:hypothetical protein
VYNHDANTWFPRNAASADPKGWYFFTKLFAKLVDRPDVFPPVLNTPSTPNPTL